MPARLLTSPDEAAALLLQGKLVAFPTDTVYGIAALADERFDNAALRAFKGGRSERFSLHSGSVADAAKFAGPLNAAETRLVRRWCPHGVTLVVAHAALGTLGVRVVGDALGSAMLRACGAPVVATSANLHGQPVLPDPAEIAQLPGIDAVLDGGLQKYTYASTVAALLPVGMKVLRQGKTELKPLNVVFVCIGNLNRSAFAHRWLDAANAWWASRVAGYVPALHAESMGLIARASAKVPQPMQAAAARYGVDLSSHVPRALDPAALASADVVVALNDEVVAAVAPIAGDRLLNLKVKDPMGGPEAGFAACAADVLRALESQFVARLASPADAAYEPAFREVMYGEDRSRNP